MSRTPTPLLPLTRAADMRSIDTNVLLYSLNEDCPEFHRATDVVDDLGRSRDVVISELVLVELYMLLRNPAVLADPLPAGDAVEICEVFRSNPNWALIESAPVMDDVWRHAAEPRFARRRIIDARLALTLRHAGVTEFITRNVRDFRDLGFERVWDPFGRRA